MSVNRCSNQLPQYSYHNIMEHLQGRPINDKFSIIDSRLLGKGSTGNVYMGYERRNPSNLVAVKVIDLQNIDNQVTSYLLRCEIGALKSVGKIGRGAESHVVQLIDLVMVQNNVYLIMELLEGGTLRDYVNKFPNGIPQDEALKLFRQILIGYQLIASKKIIHRDLKPENMLFKAAQGAEKNVSIIDFGYCLMEGIPNKPQVYYNVGSPKYMAPQAYKQNLYSQKSDIWALGVIFYEMLAGKTCDQGMTMTAYLEMIEQQGVPLPSQGNHFCKHILGWMLKNNPSQRATIDEVLHEFSRYDRTLMHQKSEVIFLRNSMEQPPNRFSTPHKSQQVARSLIINSQQNKRGVTLEVKAPITPNKQQFAPQHILFKANSQEAVRKATFSNIERKEPIKPKILNRVQNVKMESVRQVFNQKMFGHQQPQPTQPTPPVITQAPHSSKAFNFAPSPREVDSPIATPVFTSQKAIPQTKINNINTISPKSNTIRFNFSNTPTPQPEVVPMKQPAPINNVFLQGKPQEHMSVPQRQINLVNRENIERPVPINPIPLRPAENIPLGQKIQTLHPDNKFFAAKRAEPHSPFMTEVKPFATQGDQRPHYVRVQSHLPALPLPARLIKQGP